MRKILLIYNFVGVLLNWSLIKRLVYFIIQINGFHYLIVRVEWLWCTWWVLYHSNVSVDSLETVRNNLCVDRKWMKWFTSLRSLRGTLFQMSTSSLPLRTLAILTIKQWNDGYHGLEYHHVLMLWKVRPSDRAQSIREGVFVKCVINFLSFFLSKMLVCIAFFSIWHESCISVSSLIV